MSALRPAASASSLVLDATDRLALLGLLSARTPENAQKQAARLRALLGANARLVEPHIEEVLARTRELDRAERLAATDPLTKVANRRGLSDGLRRELARAERSGRPLSLLLLDVDAFKAINDTFGHAQGDQALRVVAHCARRVTRSLDLVARVGGDEFAVMLPETGEAEARVIAERIRTELARQPGTPQVRVSIGLAMMPQHGTSASALLSAADANLYRDKAARSVRGRIHC